MVSGTEPSNTWMDKTRGTKRSKVGPPIWWWRCYDLGWNLFLGEEEIFIFVRAIWQVIFTGGTLLSKKLLIFMAPLGITFFLDDNTRPHRIAIVEESLNLLGISRLATVLSRPQSHGSCLGQATKKVYESRTTSRDYYDNITTIMGRNSSRLC